jgi:hypothetical protein
MTNCKMQKAFEFDHEFMHKIKAAMFLFYCLCVFSAFCFIILLFFLVHFVLLSYCFFSAFCFISLLVF